MGSTTAEPSGTLEEQPPVLAAPGALSAPGAEAATRVQVLTTAMPVLGGLSRAGVLKDGALQDSIIELFASDPAAVIAGLNQFVDEPFAETILLQAAETEHAGAVLKRADQFKNKPFAARVIEAAARKSFELKPSSVFEHAAAFSDLPFAGELLLAAALTADESGVAGEKAFQYLYEYAAKPYAKDVLLAAVANHGAFYALGSECRYLLGLPYAAEVLKAAALKNPFAALKFFGNYAAAPFAKDVVMPLAQSRYEEESDSQAPAPAVARLRPTFRNSPKLSPSNFAALSGVSFAEEFFTELARSNSAMVLSHANEMCISVASWFPKVRAFCSEPQPASSPA